MTGRAGIALGCAIVVAALGEAQAASRLPQDAYVWQRVWTPPLVSALNASFDLVRDWRVLAAESDSHGRLLPIAVNWNALGRTHRPVIAVIRIDGRLADWNEGRLISGLESIAASWRSSAAVSGLEIDYDCATARLPAYTQFLRRLRTGEAMRLSITALPDWMSSPNFDGVLAATDEVVLQVHAVRAPRLGLFDAVTARQWIDALDARTTKPFRVALPDYAARVVEAENGRIVAVESEVPKLAGGKSETQLIAAPEKVAGLLRDLARNPPRHLAGIAWFRLPTAADTETWSTSTWRAVVSGRDLSARVVALARSSTVPDVENIVLENDGDIDGALPSAVGLPRGCRLADGINGYSLRREGDEISLMRLQLGLLYAHHSQVIGWMRCKGAGANFHVRP